VSVTRNREIVMVAEGGNSVRLKTSSKSRWQSRKNQYVVVPGIWIECKATLSQDEVFELQEALTEMLGYLEDVL
jgi:hypothetical protein